ncbi:MAG: SprT family zinc-dependent metalloprotease [Candidatus Dactylopiibacterium sp.]|nr:SprT family zinc-dependent metalloprotease [Candidatus Dactylopiibacterium sp.]
MATPAAEARRIVLQGQEVAFELRRSARRTLGLRVDRRGLTVSLPQHTPLGEAEAFMRARAGWILEKLGEWRQRAAATTARVTDGMTLPVFGRPCRVVWRAGTNRARWVEGFDSRELQLQLRREADAPRVLLRALQDYALAYFAGRVDEYVHRLALIVPRVRRPALHLSNARTRWGSCSSLSGIRLNWRLIHLPREQIDYVVAHEVAHLVEMNHSARFWQLVDALMPGFEAPRAALRHAHRVIPPLQASE